MLSSDPGLQQVEEAIGMADIPPAPGVLVGFLLLTEWVAADGESYLVESAPDAQPYWRTLGMLEATRVEMQARLRAAYQDDDDQ